MSNASKTNEYPTIADLFCLLDRWRHLPAYQFERRADIFFALFLPEVLRERLSVEINCTLIPEFPIKKMGNNQSKKADYLVLSKNGERAFLVELKTDMASISESQDKYLYDAVDDGLRKIVIGILDICMVTKSRHKYVHLLQLLVDIGLIECEDGPISAESGYIRALEKIKDKVEKTRKENWPPLEVVYILPRSTKTISFKEFAGVIKKGGGEEIRQLFAKRLTEWAANDAGSPNPKDWPSC